VEARDAGLGREFLCQPAQSALLQQIEGATENCGAQDRAEKLARVTRASRL